MTPRARAERLVHEYPAISALLSVSDELLTVRIERDIEAAVAAEREACARLVERFAEEECAGIVPGICARLGCDSYGVYCQQAMPAAIRARNGTNGTVEAPG